MWEFLFQLEGEGETLIIEWFKQTEAPGDRAYPIMLFSL